MHVFFFHLIIAKLLITCHKYELTYITTTNTTIAKLNINHTAEELSHSDASNSILHDIIDACPLFLSLHLISNAKCISYGIGGFDKFT